MMTRLSACVQSADQSSQLHYLAMACRAAPPTTTTTQLKCATDCKRIGHMPMCWYLKKKKRRKKRNIFIHIVPVGRKWSVWVARIQLSIEQQQEIERTTKANRVKLDQE